MNTFSLPKKGEYPAYYDTYISKIPDENFSSLIFQQVDAIHDLFHSKSDGWDSRPYEAGKWTPKEVLGHIIDTERIMTFRALCFSRGESQALPGFDQDDYVANGKFDRVPAEFLLADFVAQRKALVTLIATLDEGILDFAGNANGNPITPRSLFWIIPGHFIHHFSILNERY
jgi:hypothetical protein